MLFILLGFLMVMNTVLLYIVIKEPDKKPRPPREFIYDRLDFNKDQIDRFFLIDDAHHEKMRAIDRESRLLKEQLFSRIRGNELLIDSLASQIGALTKERELEVYHYFKRIEEICDERQKRKLERILKGAIRPRPPAHGPPPGGPPPR